MSKTLLKRIAVIVVVGLTIVLFVHYFVTHPEYWHQLKTVSPWVIVWVIALNALMVGVLTLISDTTIRMCGKTMRPMENFLLTSYSSLANFFGPLQSGPGVRAVYLKSRHQVRLRDYTLASLIALGLFAAYSALFLLVGMRPWWETTLAMIAVASVSYVVIRYFRKKDKEPNESHFRLTSSLLSRILLFTFIQVVITVAWYFVELHAVNPSISLAQAMSYAGAANFSLFVSFTPDAVGIREAFLLFSQNIHHVSTQDIIAANVIDRVSYAVFLVLLFILTLSLHAKDRLKLAKIQSAVESDEPTKQ